MVKLVEHSGPMIVQLLQQDIIVHDEHILRGCIRRPRRYVGDGERCVAKVRIRLVQMDGKVARYVVRDVRIKSCATVSFRVRRSSPNGIVVVRIFPVVRHVRCTADKTVLGRCSLASQRPDSVVLVVPHHGAQFLFVIRTRDELERLVVPGH